MQAENSTSGISGNKLYTALFKALGAKVVYDQTNFPATATGADYTPYVQAILAAQAQHRLHLDAVRRYRRLRLGPQAAGYKGLTMDFVTYAPGLLASSPQLAASLQGEYINNQTVPQEENTPFTKQELADLTPSAPRNNR